MGDGEAAVWYRKHAKEIEPAIAKHRSADNGFLVVTLDPSRLSMAKSHRFGFVARSAAEFKPSGLDAAVVLGALHGDTGDGFFGPSDDWILGTAFHLERAFREIYPINRAQELAPAIGQYPEDTYFGGNPWFLCTLAFAELYARAARGIAKAGRIVVTNQDAALFSDVLSREGYPSPPPTPGTVLRPQHAAFKALVTGLSRRSAAFFDRVRLHVDAEGRMAEQFSRHTGFQLSARDLTWNYAAFLNAAGAYLPHSESSRGAFRYLEREF
jgi:glucoamylase